MMGKEEADEAAIRSSALSAVGVGGGRASSRSNAASKKSAAATPALSPRNKKSGLPNNDGPGTGYITMEQATKG